MVGFDGGSDDSNDDLRRGDESGDVMEDGEDVDKAGADDDGGVDEIG